MSNPSAALLGVPGGPAQLGTWKAPGRRCCQPPGWAVLCTAAVPTSCPGPPPTHVPSWGHWSGRGRRATHMKTFPSQAGGRGASSDTSSVAMRARQRSGPAAVNFRPHFGSPSTAPRPPRGWVPTQHGATHRLPGANCCKHRIESRWLGL